MQLISLFQRVMTGLLTLVYTHRIKAVIVLIAALFGFISSNLPNIQKDGRVEAFMHEDDPALATYYAMRREFGQDNRVVVAVTSDAVFTTEFLTKFSQMHRELAEKVPYVSEVFSPYNIPFIEHENGGVYLEELVRNLLARGRDPMELRDRILTTPLYRNFIISEDGHTAAVVIEPYRYAPAKADCVPNPSEGITCPVVFTPLSERALLGAPQYAEMTAVAQEIAARYEGEGFDIHIAGAPVLSTEIVKMMEQDMPRFTLACVVLTVLTMLILHRSFLIALGAFLSFASALLSTLATVAASGIAMTPPTQLLIPMTLVVVLCTYIHFIATLLKTRSTEPHGPTALAKAVAATNTPILFTALTTAGGLMGLAAAPLAPIFALGVFGAVSVGLSYILAMVWATLVFRTLPERFLNAQRDTAGMIASGMRSLAISAARAPGLTLGATSVLLMIAGVAMTQLSYSHNSLLWLPQDNDARRSTEFMDANFKGTVNLEMVITPTEGFDFRDETLLKAVETTARGSYDAVDIPIGRHTSIISFVEETNQAIHDGDPQELRIPEQEAIWDQLLLLEGQGIDDMKRYVSLDYSSGRVSFQTPWLEAKAYTDVINTIEARFNAALGATAKVESTGLIALLAKTSKKVLDSMTISYGLALVLVTTMMALALRSVGLGLVSMVPNVVPFALLLGLMGYLGIPLDTFTVLIGGIITGLIVDDTLHFFHGVRERFAAGEEMEKAIANTMSDIGRALFTTTLVVTAGFTVFTLSSMNNIQSFGLLMASGAILALMSELFVGPAVLMLYAKFLKARTGDRVQAKLGAQDATA
ncbi:MMPL family transporter (plasmid) [Aliiroseovarius crassostreae]|uniref:MMPL family transporter n=1 Tax=Aliiroseovarius crassostreae TaxID=154981 RepID=A0A9Q9HCP1_9RHOB|nr:MMPL family transporter [Aliiroseovarius crassostreae]UWP97213.1 MMPL family transporter [Aliiroseovarius crassostreae]